MKISVIIPVYNCEEYIAECVESILKQTIKAYEIILVDDGSTDLSPEKCNQYADIYPQIKAYHKSNEGLGLTRNYGIERASGEYVLFIDADDYLDIDFIEKTISAMEKYGCDTCKTCFKRVDQNRNYSFVNRVEREEVFEDQEIRDSFIPRLIGSEPGKHDALPMSACCTLYSLKLIKENDIRFESEREWISEDIIFNIQYYAVAKKAIVIPYIGYNYRFNSISLTRKYREDRFEKSKMLVIREDEMLSNFIAERKYKARLYQQMLIYTYMSVNQLGVSGLDRKQITKKIRQICQDEYLQRIVKEIPKKNMGVKQRVFLLLIRFKLASLLKWALVDKKLS